VQLRTLRRNAVTRVAQPVHRLDLRAAAALARTQVPGPIDRALPRLTRAADYSMLWMSIAAVLGASRNRTATRAAARRASPTWLASSTPITV